MGVLEQGAEGWRGARCREPGVCPGPASVATPGPAPTGGSLWGLALPEPLNQLPRPRLLLSFRKTMLNDLLRFDVKDCSWCRWVPLARTQSAPQPGPVHAEREMLRGVDDRTQPLC